MRLKHLSLHGFKTFAPRTDLQFGEGLTAIVGPNGSGKSNVADAVRWVLGEQSLSNLRAKRTEDLIFAGSSNRAPVGMAEVSITIENTDHLLPLDFAEVTLTRRAYRSGENEYFVNKSRVRLRDILDVASTLGQAYTVVGQGLVDAALSLRPEERRELFEEAAAIRGYFVQREDALKRLQKTEENIARVNDLVAELEPQVRRLERQARQAQDYLKLSDELKALLRLWYGGRWAQAASALQAARVAEEAALVEVSQRKQAVSALSTRLAEIRARVWELVGRVSQLHEERAQAQSRHAAQVQAQAVTTERLVSAGQTRTALVKDGEGLLDASQALSQRQADLLQEIDRHAQEVHEIQAEGRDVDAELADLDSQIARAESGHDHKAAHLENLLLRETSLQNSIANAERTASEQDRGATEAENAIATLHTRLAEAEAMLDAKHTALGAEQLAVAQAERDHASLTETVSSARHELSRVETARRDALRHIELLSGQIVALLGEQSAGLFGGVRAVVTAAGQGRLNGFVGTVAELLHVPSEYEPAIEAALGGRLQDVVVESWSDAEAAIAFLKSSGAGRATFLPLDTLRSSRTSTPPTGAGIIGLARELVRYEPRLATLAESLLGRILIVEDLPSARRALAGMPVSAPWTLATLGGDVVRPGGSVTGGSNTRGDDRSARGKTILARERRRRELQHAYEEARIALTRAEQAQEHALTSLRSHETRLASSSSALEDARKRQSAAQLLYMEQGSVVSRLQQELSWRTGLLAETRREIERLRHSASDMKDSLASLGGEIGPQRELLAESSAQLSELRSQRGRASQATAERRTRLAVLAETLRNLRARQEETDRELVRVEKQRSELRSLAEAGEVDEKRLRDALIAHEAEATKLASLVSDIELRIGPSEQEVRNAEAQANALENELSSLQTALLESETVHSRTAVETQRCLGVLSSLRIEIAEELGAPSEPELDTNPTSSNVATESPIRIGDGNQSAQSLQPHDTELDIKSPVELESEASIPAPEEANERERRVYAVRSRLSRLGPVNPLAMEEHAALAERHSFLQTQLIDLMAAADSLRHVIGELDRTMRDQFAATFAQVNDAFSTFFNTLFGGGTARLDLTNPDDITSSGVDIMAQPPGKRLQPLAALSGGERALTSAALLFALLKVRPVPFCVLDEVDAALDESNVSRFRAALQELGSNTQFVIITHNRGTIEAADTLYGVSMAGDGTSQLLSLRVEERATA